MSTNRRVVVTGMGAVTPLGLDLETTWQNLVSGKSGAGPITLFDASEFKTKIACEVKDFPFDVWIKQNARLEHAMRGTFFALKATEEALLQSGISNGDSFLERMGIYYGSGDSGFDFKGFTGSMKPAFEDEYGTVQAGKYLKASEKNLHPLKELELQPFMAITHIAKTFRIRGPVSNTITACAASSQAIGEAYEWIKRGDADVMISGGSSSMIYPLGIAGFSLLTALSTRNDEPHKASRPFDKNRDGFVMAEGACSLVLEELEHAKQRGAAILGEIVGYGATADAYRLTDMSPDVEPASEAVRIAMKKSSFKPEEIDYISAHGTSTSVNDSSETHVAKKTMGEFASKIPMSSIKSMIGHMITAAGALETATCFLAMRDGTIPPTINLENQDDICDLDYVPNQCRKQPVERAITNSFGFGGQNISLAVQKY